MSERAAMNNMIAALAVLSSLVLSGCQTPSSRVLDGPDRVPADISGVYSFEAGSFSGDPNVGFHLFPWLPLKDNSVVVVSQTDLPLPTFRYVTADGVTRTNDLSDQEQYWAWQGGGLVYGLIAWEVPWVPVGLLRHEWIGRIALDDTGNMVCRTRLRTTGRPLFIVPVGSEERDCRFVLRRVR